MKTLITGAFPLNEQQKTELERLGLAITVHPDERMPVAEPEQYKAVICNGLFLYNPISAFRSLKYIQLTSAGLDRAPLDYIESHNLVLCSAKGVYSIPMSEFALCGVLQLYKKAAFFRQNQAIGSWQKQRDLRELFGKRVTVVGCGSVGTHCAQRFSAFSCVVTGIDLYPAKNPAFAQVLPLTELDAQLPQTDVLVLTLPLTEKTRHCMDEKRFALMKKDAVLVNIARGAVVDADALRSWLSENPASGAVLDVFETEPLPSDDPLWTLENAILTPHNSFVSVDNAERLYRLIYRNFQEWSAGEAK